MRELKSWAHIWDVPSFVLKTGCDSGLGIIDIQSQNNAL